VLKFNPDVSLEQGLEMTFEWYRGQSFEFGIGNAECGKKKRTEF
jgi:hypothetical protein